MFGAILGDSICSPYDFNQRNNAAVHKTGLHYSDNTIMTIAISDALLICKDPAQLKTEFLKSLQHAEYHFPNAGYIKDDMNQSGEYRPSSYFHNTNGAFVRVSSIPYYFVHDLDKTRLVARLSAEVTEDREENILSAEAIAGAIWLAIHGKDKKDIRKFLIKEFNFISSIVLTAFSAFYKGTNYISVIDNVKKIGHDTACLAAIAGGIAEAYYGMTDKQEDACFDVFGRGMSALILRTSLLNFEIATNRAILSDPHLRKDFLT